MKKIISGKVRDVYEISDDKMVIVTTDRISAFDVILSKPVPDKGKILNAISLFWFDYTKDIVPNHIISSDISDMPEHFQKPEYEGRTILVKKLKMLPFEFIIRGYMFGSMWDAYTQNKPFCGLKIREGYKQAEKLDTPLFTPSTKAHVGHDEYISSDEVAGSLSEQLLKKVESISIEIYQTCYEYAYKRGIIIADTKFEFGTDNDGNLVLADEVLTPDSSRFWKLDEYQVGTSPKSYDKQFVRDWLQNNKTGGEMQFDNVPDDVISNTSKIYNECLRRLTNAG